MATRPDSLSTLDRFLNRFTEVEPNEGRGVVLFFLYAFLMMVSYYIIKTIREPLLLTGNSAAMKSYAYAAVALLLFLLVPVYGAVFRHTGKQQLTRYVSLFFMVNLGLFYLAGRAGWDVAFAYYVWVGIFGVFITAQFWAFAADSYGMKSGERLFPVIMVGATLGGLAAPWFSGRLFPVLGPWVLLLVALALLALTLPLVSWARSAVPPGSRAIAVDQGSRSSGGLLAGIALVLTDRYLFLLALLILLLNWVNTTGEYILAELVVQRADALLATGEISDKSDFIAGFYGSFFGLVNLVTLLAQLFLVARIIRWIGVSGAVMVLPVLAIIGYGLVMFVPVFSVIRLVKTLENSTDYSLMNTTRHALYLPLTPAKKYEGKTTIDAFFWRIGDLLQAAAIYAGLNWFQFGIMEFAFFNMLLSALWLLVAWHVARIYRRHEQAVAEAVPLSGEQPG